MAVEEERQEVVTCAQKSGHMKRDIEELWRAAMKLQRWCRGAVVIVHSTLAGSATELSGALEVWRICIENNISSRN